VPAVEPVELTPENIPLDIVFENDDLVIVNKPAGMVVHPAPGHSSGTLVHAALGSFSGLKGIGGEMRPGIVHRLDKDTSGLIIVAKTTDRTAWCAGPVQIAKSSKVYSRWWTETTHSIREGRGGDRS